MCDLCVKVVKGLFQAKIIFINIINICIMGTLTTATLVMAERTIHHTGRTNGKLCDIEAVINSTVKGDSIAIRDEVETIIRIQLYKTRHPDFRKTSRREEGRSLFLLPQPCSLPLPPPVHTFIFLCN